MNEDRISQLPEALILEILSQLPTKDAMATSLLSKQWKSLWKMMPKLNFDSSDHRFDELIGHFQRMFAVLCFHIRLRF